MADLDLAKTQMQETGATYVHNYTLAQINEIIAALGIDPCDVIVNHDMLVLDRAAGEGDTRAARRSSIATATATRKVPGSAMSARLRNASRTRNARLICSLRMSGSTSYRRISRAGGSHD